MARRNGVIALSLLAVGCASLDGRPSAILPTQLSLLVEDRQGEPVSLVMDLRRNTRNQLDVRVSQGLRLFDGEHLWLFEVHQEGADYVVGLSDERSGGRRDLPFRSSTPPRLLAVHRLEARLATDRGVVQCALLRPVCGPAEGPGQSPLDHLGPGRGFHAWLTPTGEVRLTLPLDTDDRGQPILSNVGRVLGAHWVHEGFLQRDPILDRTFRGRASLVAMAHAVDVDGELAEWRGAEPLIVESPWQIDAGAETWAGPEDASFSVTAARTDEGACFAGRVRDDAFADGDELVLHVGGASATVPTSAPGMMSAGVIRREWFGRRFEICLDFPSERDQLPFYAAYEDVDPGQTVTMLASAPLEELTGTGTLRVTP